MPSIARPSSAACVLVIASAIYRMLACSAKQGIFPAQTPLVPWSTARPWGCFSGALYLIAAHTSSELKLHLRNAGSPCRPGSIVCATTVNTTSAGETPAIVAASGCTKPLGQSAGFGQRTHGQTILQSCKWALSTMYVQWHNFWTLNLSDVRMQAVPSLWGTTDLSGTTFSSQRMNRASKKSHLDSGWQWVATSFRLSRLMSTHVNSTCICQLTPWAMQDFNQKSALCNCHSMFFHAIP